MNEEADGLPERPDIRPADPRFSCGPCKKHPGWDVSHLNLESLGRNHRGKATKQRLTDAITRSHQLLGLPDDWKLGIVPGSDTGAFEMAIWSLLGSRPVDVIAWEAFSGDWVTDLKQLNFDNTRTFVSAYGEMPDLAELNSAHDIVTVYNGTTSGVRLPHLDWVDADREGLVLCDATSAAFAMPMDVIAWEAFSGDWVTDLKQLNFDNTRTFVSAYGEMPDLAELNSAHDIVTVYNGTTSGVRLPHLDWVDADREGLVLCDATSAAFAMPMDFSKLDVVTWSWQKVLGGEAAHGMLALSPRAIERLETTTPVYPLPKLFRLTKNGKLIDAIFTGGTINTPSLLSVEDLHAALDWAEGLGGVDALYQRTQSNFDCIDQWVAQTAWVDWLPQNPAIRSPTSMCLRIVDASFTARSAEEQQQSIDRMVASLEQEAVAYDIGNYRTAPPGFRIWGGSTIETSDLQALTPWLEWAYACEGGAA